MSSPDPIKDKITQIIEALHGRPAGAQATFRASTQREAGFRCSAQARGKHAITVDESPRMGGTDQGMNPVELMLCAMGTCQEIMYTVYAALLGIPLDGVRIECRGKLDLRGLFSMDDSVPAGFMDVEFETQIQSSAGKERILKLVELAERHCPIMDTLARPIRARGTAFLNGEPIACTGEAAAGAS